MRVREKKGKKGKKEKKGAKSASWEEDGREDEDRREAERRGAERRGLCRHVGRPDGYDLYFFPIVRIKNGKCS